MIIKLSNKKAKGQPDKQFALTAAPLAPVLIKDFPEIEKAVRLETYAALIGYKNEHFFTDKFLFADSTFSCLGLFGLVMVAVSQRTKEIGVRKVLGVSVTGITTLLSKDFIRLVIVSIIIATPIARWMMNTWLSNFAYRIPLSWWIFLAARIAVILIVVATVFYTANKELYTIFDNIRTFSYLMCSFSHTSYF